ncbi:hypothetical protein ACFYY2_07640 [Streptomyces sp. NPDC001822]|uniref:hypothetical protein n=1 Tax=Streptomyces sp. NPDC001822 TaxID=3364614 RepID=UPI0036CA8AD0
MTESEFLTVPSITDAEIEELMQLRASGWVTDAFLVRLAYHFLKAEAEGVINPARHLAEYIGVQRQTVLTYMRMARRTGIITRP